MRKAKLMVMPLSVMLVLLGCNLSSPGSGTVSGGEMAAFQKVFMSSYYADHGGRPGGARALTPFYSTGGSGVPSRTTVPVLLLTSFSFTNPQPNPILNYPEPGETTSFTLTWKDQPNNVYDVLVTTTYPAGDIRKNYVEEYYVQDYPLAAPDGNWTVDDPIVSNASGPWLQDQKARVKQVLTFTDGTTRTEHIVSQTDFTTTNLPKFPAFDVNGSLNFGQLFIPGTDTGAVFSSVVTYSVTPSTNSNFWFWQGSQAQTILGIRYYTEFNDGLHYYTYTIAFEKTLSTLSTTGLSTPAVWQTVFVGSQYDTLAESVLRQQVTYTLDAGKPNLSTGVVTTNMQTRVVDITGQKDFYLQQLNTDYVNLSSWDTTTVYTPTGSAAEIVAGDPTKFLYGRTLAGAGGGQPLAVASTVGLGDLAQLYQALTLGAASQPASGAVSLFTGTNSDLVFDGTNKGSEFSSASYDLSPAGTIEAWVYIKQQTDTGGIVHKGVNPNFSDECYSLQFWGNQGQLALALDGPGGSSYDLLTSTINLNTGKWYYLAATWDRTTIPNSMNLYIDGVLNATKVPVLASPQVNGSDILIGSQLPSTYSPAYGYFTFNGAIAGVILTNSALPAATILAHYNALAPSTGSWSHP